MIGIELKLAGAGMRLVLIAAWEQLRAVPRPASRLPVALRRTLERLGPVFVKAGQAASLRRDLLPQAYLDELAHLRDDVAPVPVAAVRAEIAGSLGRPVDELFASFEDRPMAAASIAQVHAARLHDGRAVVVKVRRPGIRRRIDRDMRALRRLIRILAAISARVRQMQPLEVADEIRANLLRETDFVQEARAMNRFAAAFDGSTSIEAPEVVQELVSEAVLVQQRKSGKSLADVAGGARSSALARQLLDSYLHQVFAVGFFHGDPHPGNIFITERGAICFHDFGLSGQLDTRTRRDLAMFLQGFVQQDAGWMLDYALALGLIAPDVPKEALQRGFNDILADFAAMPLGQWSIAELFARVSRLGPPGSVLVPYNLLVLMRAMFLLESALRLLDPGLRPVEILSEKGRDFVRRLVTPSEGADRLKNELGIAAAAAPAAIAEAVNRLRRGEIGLSMEIRVRELDSVRRSLDRSVGRLAVALLTLGLFIGSSQLMQHPIGPKLFEMPALALGGYALAIWYTLRMLRAIARSGHL